MTEPTPATGWRPPAQPPDVIRSRVRTAAQAAWGVLWAVLARYAADRLGLDLPLEIPAELAYILSGAVVGLFAAAWMWVVARLSRVWPIVERVFLLNGSPVYPGEPVLKAGPKNL